MLRCIRTSGCTTTNGGTPVTMRPPPWSCEAPFVPNNPPCGHMAARRNHILYTKSGVHGGLFGRIGDTHDHGGGRIVTGVPPLVGGQPTVRVGFLSPPECHPSRLRPSTREELKPRVSMGWHSGGRRKASRTVGCPPTNGMMPVRLSPPSWSCVSPILPNNPPCEPDPRETILRAPQFKIIYFTSTSQLPQKFRGAAKGTPPRTPPLLPRATRIASSVISPSPMAPQIQLHARCFPYNVCGNTHTQIDGPALAFLNSSLHII